MRRAFLIAVLFFQIARPAEAGEEGWNARGRRVDAIRAAGRVLARSGLGRVIHGARFSRLPVAGDAERKIPGLKQAASDVREAVATLAKASTHARVVDFETGGPLDRLVNFMDGDERIGYLRVTLTRENKTPTPGLRQRQMRSEINLDARREDGSDGSAIVHIIDLEERLGSTRFGELIVNLVLDRGPEHDLLHERHTWRHEPGEPKVWDAKVVGSAFRGQVWKESIPYTRTVGGASP